jgi:hypothetical protein
MFAAVLFCSAGAAHAQTESRIEVGALASFLRLSTFDTANAGFGGRVSFDLTSWAALEAEADYFPSDDVLERPSDLFPDLRVAYERRRTDAFFGVKLGRRTDRFGLFGKVRPGLTRLSEVESGQGCIGSECPLILLARPEYRTEFALDFGGVFEFYPSDRTVTRFELGDTMIRHTGRAPGCWTGDCTSHNFSSRLGVGVRF